METLIEAATPMATAPRYLVKVSVTLIERESTGPVRTWM
ncbi:hypothetical protein RTCIAT899_PC04030 (plasmid) [Rhizobium tropici CIAT 899]|nr:hypothetical protein RTCIAT899_PC04030 [Rhizobium tropici CIAT 899]